MASLHVVYPSIAPNAGFRAQLELWQAMGCRLDPQHEAYKRLSLQTLGNKWAEHGSVAQESLPDPEAASSAQVGRHCLRICACSLLQTGTVEQKSLPESNVACLRLGCSTRSQVCCVPTPASSLLVDMHTRLAGLPQPVIAPAQSAVCAAGRRHALHIMTRHNDESQKQTIAVQS